MELRLTIQEILPFKASNGSSVKPVKVKFDVFFVYFLTCFEMVTENKYFGYKEWKNTWDYNRLIKKEKKHKKKIPNESSFVIQMNHLLL